MEKASSLLCKVWMTRGTYVVLAAELLAERGGHDLAADGRRRREVRLARLAAGGGDVCTLGEGVSETGLTIHTTSTTPPTNPTESTVPSTPIPLGSTGAAFYTATDEH